MQHIDKQIATAEASKVASTLAQQLRAKIAERGSTQVLPGLNTGSASLNGVFDLAQLEAIVAHMKALGAPEQGRAKTGHRGLFSLL